MPCVLTPRFLSPAFLPAAPPTHKPTRALAVARGGGYGRRATSKDTVMQLSARNQIAGIVAAITPGAVNGSVKVDIGGGTIVTANITEEAIHELALAVGDAVTVIVKASDVLIGK